MHKTKPFQDKRAELVLEVEHLQRRISDIQTDIERLDMALKIVDPDLKIEGIPARKYFRYKNAYRYGELAQAILTVLRASEKPLRGCEIQRRVAEKFGMPSHLAVAGGIRSSVKALLEQGRIQKTGKNRQAMWSIPGNNDKIEVIRPAATVR